MKKSKKIQNKLDKRIADFKSIIGTTKTKFHQPGSQNLKK